VDAEPLVVGEREQGGVGDGADAGLDRGPVVHQLGAVTADRLLLLGERLLGQLEDGLVHLDEVVDLVHVDEAVAVRPRHARVHLGDDDLRGLHRRDRGVDADAERAVAVLVRRGDVHERDVERQDGLAEQPRDLGEEDRHVVAAPLLDRLAGGRSHEDGVHAEALGELGRRVPRGTHLAEAQDLDDPELGRAIGHGLEQDPRARGHAVDVHAVAGADDGDRLGGGREASHR